MEPLDADPTQRFSDRATDYALYRPGYPTAAIDAILLGLPAAAQLSVADIGAGTGIAARLFAARGARVIAVEPNAAMRQAAAPQARVTFRAGTAEQTGLATGAHHLVTVAQAFHWFNTLASQREFHRVLVPGGRLAVFWNRRDRDDPFTLGYRDALQATDAEAPVERSQFDAAAIASAGMFTNLRAQTFVNAHPLTEQQLIGRAMSTSTVPRSGPRLAQLLGLLRDLHARHRSPAGCCTMVYQTQVFCWDRVDR